MKNGFFFSPSKEKGKEEARSQARVCLCWGGGGGWVGTAIYGLYRYVPL